MNLDGFCAPCHPEKDQGKKDKTYPPPVCPGKMFQIRYALWIERIKIREDASEIKRIRGRYSHLAGENRIKEMAIAYSCNSSIS